MRSSFLSKVGMNLSRFHTQRLLFQRNDELPLLLFQELQTLILVGGYILLFIYPSITNVPFFNLLLVVYIILTLFFSVDSLKVDFKIKKREQQQQQFYLVVVCHFVCIIVILNFSLCVLLCLRFYFYAILFFQISVTLTYCLVFYESRPTYYRLDTMTHKDALSHKMTCT